MATDTTTDEKEAAHAKLRELWAERSGVLDRLDEVNARIEDASTAYDLAAGDLLSAEYHRLSAVMIRNRTPETEAATHKAWLLMMATSHIRSGREPEGYKADEVRAEMARLRGSSVGVQP